MTRLHKWHYDAVQCTVYSVQCTLYTRQEYKFFMGVFQDRTWEELRRIGTARGSWSDHFPFVFGQDKAFLLLQQTAVQSSILFLSRTVDKILQTCSVVKD